MRCPFCAEEDTQVKDSRQSDDGSSVKRRRYCQKCNFRFTTFERVQLRELTVIKKNGDRRPFDRDKILRSICTALRKRAVGNDKIEMLINYIVQKFEQQGDSEIYSLKIGEEIMKQLSLLDEVACIRFASVYQDFNNAKDFEQFIHNLHNNEN